MTRLAKPRAILFDWDNTLVDTWPVIHAALHHTFTDMGKEPWTLEQTRARVKKSMRDSFPELFGERWEEAGKLYQQHYRSRHLQELKPLPMAEEVLRRLRELPIYMAVVSNKKNYNLRAEAEHLGWEHYFDSLVGADDAPHDKPHPDPVHLALEGSGIVPGADVWFLGDTGIDLECAQATGCTPLLYGDHRLEREGVHEGFPFHHHSRDHTAFLELLKQLAD